MVIATILQIFLDQFDYCFENVFFMCSFLFISWNFKYLTIVNQLSPINKVIKNLLVFISKF